MISYASCWRDGRHAWQLLHDSRQGREHLEIHGDMPPEFDELRNTAIERQQAKQTPKKPGDVWGEDVFEVPLDVAATITVYRETFPIEDAFFADVRSLKPINGNVLTKLSQPPTWWQTAGSTRYA
jgi:hypothetical protein